MRITTMEAPVSSTEPVESTITSLAVIEETSAALIYAPGALTSLVDRIKQEVRGQLSMLDVSIPKDRKRIISLADRVASSKVKLDKMGDSLIEEHRAIVTAVNADRKVMRDSLDAFKAEVRKPVTDLENAEKERVAAHEAALWEIVELGKIFETLSKEAAQERILRIQVINKRDWQEFTIRAAKSVEFAYQALNEANESAKRREEEALELIRLRAEAAERAIKEREEAAALAAKQAAERKAEEQARLAREATEAEQRRIENERIEAEARARQAEAEKIEAEQRAARELQEAEERRKREAEQAETRRKADAEAATRREVEAAAQAKRDQDAAIERERQRVAAEKRHELEEAEKRAKNRAHLAAVNREVLAAMVKVGASDELGKALIAAIVKGEIPHMTITY